MRGIAGMVGNRISRTAAETMLATMIGNNTSANISYLDRQCCLMDSFSASGSCTWELDHFNVVFHGAIFNREETKRALTELGHRFENGCDAELVLHAYIQWQEESLQHLNGVFSFAIWSKNEGKIFIARDRIGVKPLFYSIQDGLFIFASHIKTILAHPDCNAKIDSEGVAQLLLLGPGRIPGSGVFKDIYELRPGWFGIYSEGKWHPQQYWRLKDREHTENFEDTAHHVRELLLDAIKRQTESGSQIATFLSGGLDSSIISSVCSRISEQHQGRLLTFSVDYQDHEKHFHPGKFQPESDRRYIDLMKKELQSIHTDVVLTPEDLIDCLDEATLARDLPGMGDVDFSLFAFGKQVCQKVPVAFSGECADEIFGGYPWYRDPEIRATEGFPWAQNTNFRAGFIRPEHLRHIDPRTFVMDQYNSTINNSDILPGTNRLERRMKELVNLNFDWFMQTLLDRTDRMCMYHDLDVRVPFCDYRIAEYLYGVPWSFKDYRGQEKGLLRHAMKDLLPNEVLYRKKSPYPKTHDPKYLEIVSKKLEEIVSDPTSPIFQVVEADALKSLVSAVFSHPWYGQLMKLPQTITYMLQLDRWMELYGVTVV